MIGLPSGTRIWIAAGVTDLRRGFTGLSGMVQTAFKENPFSGHVFVFRGPEQLVARTQCSSSSPSSVAIGVSVPN